MSELYNDGIMTLCSLTNTAKNGGMPVEVLKEITSQYFSEQSIGLTRAYLAKGADEQVDMVIQIQNEGVRPRIGQYVVLKNYDGQENENGDHYRINLVQSHMNDDELKVYSLTLQRLENNYDKVI